MALGIGGLSISHLLRELGYLGQTFAHEPLLEGDVAPICFPSASLHSISFCCSLHLALLPV